MNRSKPMPRMSAKRLAAFDAKGFRPRSTLDKPDGQKTAPKPKRYTDTGPDEATVALIRRRDRGRCACCGDRAIGRRGIEWCIAHRKLRAHGVDNRPSNLYLSCGNPHWGCEAETHRHVGRAIDAGRMLRSTENPEEIPMEHSVHGTVLLDNDGGVVVIQAVREEPDEHPF